jgi:heme/copper-type cytochrome/quinol oxidase subunit 3
MSQAVAPIDALGQAEYGRRTFGFTPGKFAMWLFLASDAMGFIGLISAYIVLRWSNPAATWIPTAGDWSVGGHGSTEGLPGLAPILTGVNTFILIVSSFTMVLALDACHRGNQKGLLTWLGATALFGSVFLGVQVYEYSHLLEQGLAMWHHPYGATFYMCTGFHGAHVLSGVIYLIVMWLNALKGKYGPHNSSPIELVGLFWHFVDLVWIVLFTIIYLF